MKPWMICHNGNLKACSKAYSAILNYINYVPVCSKDKLENYNAIELIVDNTIKGISITVSDSDGENQSIIIKGEDDAHLLYAVSDFKNIYLPYARNAEKHLYPYFVNELFTKPLKEYNYSCVPTVKDRGIWLWGYTVYDYRKFIDNMLELKFNTLIVWNDDLPINIKEFIDYAHQNYVKVYLGFAWGWDTFAPKNINDEYIDGIAKKVINTYEKDYNCLDLDGIYFQSFTEHNNEYIGGVLVAEAVTKLVNGVGGKLLEKYSNLKLLFGLHATSVINRLEHIKNVDKRISIIWEDVGAFPFNYITTKIDGFEKTVENTKKIVTLRGCSDGAVLKGAICLDWGTFKHYEGAYVLGEADKNYIKHRADEKREVLRIIQAGWLKNGKYALEVIKNFEYNSMVTCLVEDGMFEEIVSLPTALYSAMLWNSNRTYEDVIFEVAMRKDVDFV